MPKRSKVDLVVVGAGVVGLGLAWAAARRGMTVGVFERSARSQGASIRNFGMIWPIGQPLGERRNLALRNRELWLELGKHAGFMLETCGSLHVAHHEDEYQVLREFSQQLPEEVEMLNSHQVLKKSRWVNPVGLVGGMWSPIECRIDPRQAIGMIPKYLESIGVDCNFGDQITRAEDGQAFSASGRQVQAKAIIICNGSELANLFPSHHAALGLRRCQLQMLRTVFQPGIASLGPHLASGLTLRHYEAFASCPTLSQVRERFQRADPRLDEWGIHVMLSQSSTGEMILGDSHLYGDEISPFRDEEIDQLILREMKCVYSLDDWTIQQRWMGIYAKHPTEAWLFRQVQPGIHLLNGLGGAGMSMALAVTERILEQLFESGIDFRREENEQWQT